MNTTSEYLVLAHHNAGSRHKSEIFLSVALIEKQKKSVRKKQ